MSKKKSQQRGRQHSARRKRQTSLVIPILVGVMVLVVIVGAIMSLEGQQAPAAAVSGGPLSAVPSALPLATASIPYPDVPRISVEEARDNVEQGQAVLVDVRSKASYDKVHAAGAISVPEEEVNARLNDLPRDQELVLYCT